MTTLREAAQQALEALEKLVVGSEYEEAVEAERAIYALRAALAEPVLNPAPGYCKHCKQYTIEEPLPAEPVEEPVAYIHRQGNHWEVSERELVDDERARGWTEEPLYTAPPQRKPLTEERNFCPRCGKRTNDVHTCTPSQEDHFCDTHCTWADHAPGCVRAEPVQEPVAWRFQSAVGGWAYGSEPPLGSKYPAYPLYTAPPQRKPLTDEEIRDLWSWAMTAEAERTATTQQHAFARAIEQAHGIGEQP